MKTATFSLKNQVFSLNSQPKTPNITNLVDIKPAWVDGQAGEQIDFEREIIAALEAGTTSLHVDASVMPPYRVGLVLWSTLLRTETPSVDVYVDGAHFDALKVTLEEFASTIGFGELRG